MNLYLLRHGLAAERDRRRFPDDSLRPLLAKGAERVRALGATFPTLGISFDWILSSPYRRAAETAQIVADTLGLKKKLALCEELSPGHDARAVIRCICRLQPAPENVLLVGHEPDLSELIAQLISGNRTAAIELKKGGLAKLVIEAKLSPSGCASLVWLLTPKQLALLGGVK